MTLWIFLGLLTFFLVIYLFWTLINAERL
ncbi:MAG: K(+)-transporting ATPase subunit F [Leptospirales bacterium]